jgi:hypothetical protein
MQIWYTIPTSSSSSGGDDDGGECGGECGGGEGGGEGGGGIISRTWANQGTATRQQHSKSMWFNGDGFTTTALSRRDDDDHEHWDQLR